jgi:uncharacterized RDD family membrane protein YckC
MIRIVVENILLFLLPTLVYVAYVLVTRGRAGNPLDDAPILWLIVAGVVLVFATLIAFGTMNEGTPGQAYEPPVLRDGKIEPGRIR